MKYLIYAILILVLLAINIEFTRLFSTFPFRLNLLLLLVVFAGLEKNNYDFFGIAFTSGLLLDFYSAAPFGSFLFAFLAIAGLVNWAARTFWVYEFNWKIIGLLLAVSLTAAEVLIWASFAFSPAKEFAGVIFNFKQFWLRLVLDLPLHLLLAFPFYALWQRITRMMTKMESGKLVLR